MGMPLTVPLVAGAVSSVFYLTTLIFTLLYATGWFWVNAAINVGATITSVALVIYLYFYSTIFSVVEMAVVLNIDFSNSSHVALIATFFVWGISALAHVVRGIWVATFRLLF